MLVRHVVLLTSSVAPSLANNSHSGTHLPLLACLCFQSLPGTPFCNPFVLMVFNRMGGMGGDRRFQSGRNCPLQLPSSEKMPRTAAPQFRLSPYLITSLPPYVLLSNEHPIRMRVPTWSGPSGVEGSLFRPKPFRCHTSEISPASPVIATDPKTPSRKSFPCHTCETPRGVVRNIPPPLHIHFSALCTLCSLRPLC
jgi:hypothetical protein